MQHAIRILLLQRSLLSHMQAMHCRDTSPSYSGNRLFITSLTLSMNLIRSLTTIYSYQW